MVEAGLLPETVSLQLVSSEYFRVLALDASAGRLLTADDDRRTGDHAVAVISARFWRRRFGAAADIVGHRLAFNGASVTVVGVGPDGFSGVWLESPVDVWVPLAMQDAVRYQQNFSADHAAVDKPWASQERIWWLDLVGRAGADRDVVSAAMNTTYAQSVAQAADSIGDPQTRRLFLQQRLVLRPFGQGFSVLRQTFATPLYLLLGMVSLILLIACVNVANLLLARGTARQRELAVRLSMGAGRGRLIRQLLTESALLVLVATALGVLSAGWASDQMVRLLTGAPSAPFSVEVNGHVLGFTALVSIATGLLFGLAPALRTARVEPWAVLKGRAGAGTAGPRLTGRKVLVSCQVALSLLLVTGAGLFGRSFYNLTHVTLGFERDHVLSVWVNPRLAGYPMPRIPDLYQRLLERVTAIPGVRSASLATCGLASGCRAMNDGVTFEAYHLAPGERALIQENVVGLSYFSTVGMPLLRGRDFDARDAQHPTPKLAVVNDALARRYFAGRAPPRSAPRQRHAGCPNRRRRSGCACEHSPGERRADGVLPDAVADLCEQSRGADARGSAVDGRRRAGSGDRRRCQPAGRARHRARRSGQRQPRPRPAGGEPDDVAGARWRSVSRLLGSLA